MKRDFAASGPDQLWVADNHARADLGRLPRHAAQPRNVIHPWCQYTSIAFGMRCKEAGVRPSW